MRTSRLPTASGTGPALQRKASGSGAAPPPDGWNRDAWLDSAHRGTPVPARDAPVQRLATPAGAGAAPSADVRGKVERATGHSLAAAKVHTGAASQEASSALSARAFTIGNDIHFGAGQYQPGTAGGDRLLAHELVHTIQQDQGPSEPQLASTRVSEPGDAAEREADRIADRALSPTGSVAPVAPVERPAGISREVLNGNPAERTDAAGNPRTTHRDPTIGDAINHQAPGAAGGESRAAQVKVVAEQASPLHIEPPALPAANGVYEESAADASAAEPGFTAVSSFSGTIAQPMIEEELDDSLYIDGQPSADDVQQMSIGDCFFLASVMSIVSRDPGKITSMMSADGSGGATVTLWRRQAHSKTFWERIVGGPEYDYIQVQVQVNEQLAVNVSNGRIHGAQLRIAADPKSYDYWANVNGSALEVHRKDVYQAARWAPLLEKAYARFGQAHGEYGGARPGKPAGGSGYDVINGGVPMYAYTVFYGPEADTAEADVQRENITWSPGANPLAANPAVVDQLLLLAGRGDSAQPGDTDAPIVTAQAFVDPLIRNLQQAIPAAQADADYANISAVRQGHITAVQNAITTWNGLPPDPPPPAAQPKAAAKQAIGNACSTAVRPGPVNPANLTAIRGANPGRVLFDVGDDAVRAGDAAALIAFGNQLVANQQPQVDVDIVGHSSSDGGEAENLTLSQSRADNVEAAITAAGAMGGHNLNTSAVGEEGAEATADWRRVDVDVSPVEGDNNLHDAGRSAPIRAMMDLMLDLRNIGTDASTGQRNIYGGHSYSVVAVSFVATDGTNVPLEVLPSSMRPSFFPLVDTQQSTVTVRNPHHTNEPDRLGDNQPTRPGDGAPSGAQSDGTFTLSLDEFFRNFNAVDTGVFPRTT